MIIHPWPGPARTFREGGDTFQCQLKISICINRKWFPFPAVFPRKESELFSSSSLDSWHHGTRTKLSTLPASPGNCIIEVLFWLAISSVSFWLLRVHTVLFLADRHEPYTSVSALAFWLIRELLWLVCTNRVARSGADTVVTDSSCYSGWDDPAWFWSAIVLLYHLLAYSE